MGAAMIPGVTTSDSRQLIRLHESDNILVCRNRVQVGDLLVIDGEQFVAAENIDVGHKLARFVLNAGDTVRKYGVPIGSMTQRALIGSHVHLHNMKSNYIASHTRQADPEKGPS
jgi:(2R)-sulfolactate sulfo-lyase subunit alpha